MENNRFENHPLYKTAKRKYYFERWKWVVWNAFISLLLLIRLRQNYNLFDMILFTLTVVVTILLLAVMPKTKFENSKDCEEIKNQIR